MTKLRNTSSPLSKSAPSAWRLFLQKDLANRQRRNSNYSLRSYAQLLTISPGHLSSILSGKRPLTPKTAITLARQLGVTASDTLHWLKDFSEVKTAKAIRILNAEEFSPISEWYYYAIFGLANLKVNSADPAWIARKLKIPVQVAQRALQDLIEAKLVHFQNGQVRKTTHPVRTKIDVPSRTVRRFHRQVLQIAAEKIETVPVERREFSHMTLAVNSMKLQKAKQMLRDFVEEFTSEMTTGDQTTVCHLNIQFYPIVEGR